MLYTKQLVSPLDCKQDEGWGCVSFAQHCVSSLSGRRENRRSRKNGSRKLLYTGERM